MNRPTHRRFERSQGACSFIRELCARFLAVLGVTMVWGATLLPAAQKADIDFVGVTGFSAPQMRAALADQIESIDSSGLSPAAADDTAFFLGVFLRKNGYSQADVAWKIAPGNRLVLSVSQGPLTRIGDTIFRGNKNVPEKTLREYIIGATRERFSAMKTDLPFVEADVQTGVERIAGLYLSEGFLDVVVDPPEIAYSPDKTRASVAITIHEGQRYTFGRLSFDGDLVFFPPELLKTVEPFSKEPYSPERVTNMQRALVYYYKSRGYFEAKVDATSDPAIAKNGVVPVSFRIDSGNVFRFDGVKAAGLDRLSAKFLPNRFAKLHGKFYNPAKLDEIYRELMRTGLFKNLRVTSKPLPSNEILLDIEVEEAKAKELGFLAGYGTFEGFILGVQIGDRDLFGTGRPISAQAEISQRGLRGEILYIDPWFFESEYSLRLRLYAESQDYDGYSKVETGLRAGFSRKITKQFEATAFVQTREDIVSDKGIDPADIGPGSYLVSSVGTALTLDLRDSATNPSRGFVANTTTEFAVNSFGSSLEFIRGTARLSYYLPIKKTLLAFGARGGLIYTLNGSGGLPIDELYFNGGSRTVRSFAERDLGPADSHGYPIGGETFTVFNLEYVFPIVGDLDFAVFADAGSVGRQLSDGIGTMRYGLGGGLRYRLPVGPLRLDYGVNPSPKDNEAGGAFHFSFGFAF